VEKIVVSLSVLVPHVTSELLEQLLGKKLQNCPWPTYDPALAIKTESTIAIQVNGKLRGDIVMPRGADRLTVQTEAQKIVEKWLENKELVNVVFVADRLINFVVK
jgi:leucyl-tRNA synthetase